MSFLSTCWRRYRILGLLFSLCLSYVVLFAGGNAKMQQAAATIPKIGEAIAVSQSSAIANETSISLTQNVRKTVLENGLTVLTKEVHTAPVVTVQAWYKVGSRN